MQVKTVVGSSTPDFLCSAFLIDNSELPVSPHGVSRRRQDSERPVGPDPEVNNLGIPEDFPKKSVLAEDRRRIWIHGPRPEYRKQSQRLNLPSRITALLRPNLDVVILPGAHDPTREFWEFTRDVLGLADWQALFTPGSVYNLDDDVDDALLASLRALIAGSGGAWTLVPYCVTPNFRRWASRLADLDVAVFGDEEAWVAAYGHKGALHRHMASLGTPSLAERFVPGALVARGYACATAEQLVAAFGLLGRGPVVLKPAFGAAGEGILFLDREDDLRSYTFPMGEVVLEERLAVDLAPDGVVLSPALHYSEGQFVGDDLVDQIIKGTSYTGWRRSAVSADFSREAAHTLREWMRHTRPAGPGGVDFLSVGGRPYLSDLNTGRFNGCHGPKMFRLQYAPSSELYAWKGRTPEDLTAQEFWAKCVAAGCAFIPGASTEGVFPLLYLRGRSFMLLALGADEAACLRLRRAADAFLALPPQQAPAPAREEARPAAETSPPGPPRAPDASRPPEAQCD